MDEGYIKLFRSLQDWQWYQDSNTKDVFLHLLLNANWEDYKFKEYDVPKGSLVTSYASISRQLGLSIKSVRTAIKHLKRTGEVTVKVTNKFSIITIVNWEKYQCYDEKSTNKLTNKSTNNQPTTNQQLTTNKNIKNVRIEESKNNISSCSDPEQNHYCLHSPSPLPGQQLPPQADSLSRVPPL